MSSLSQRWSGYVNLRTLDSLMVRLYMKGLGPDVVSVVRAHRCFTVGFLLFLVCSCM